jgi:glycerophosphoryl diester phosphodiesterase
VDPKAKPWDDGLPFLARPMSIPKLPKIIGHRGAAKAAPENTLE